jgi:prophage regulatory protein
MQTVALERNMIRRVLSYENLPAKGINYSRSQIFRLIKAGKFPRPVKGIGKANGFLESEIDAFVESRVAERDTATA